MTAKVMQMPPVHQGYSTARYVLRNHPYHDLDAIDAAFEVLIYSQDPADKELCKIVAEEMWQVPRPSVVVIAITMVAVALSSIGLATLFARLAL
jgi:hypothetical protein